VELFRRNRFVIINCDVIPAYLWYNIIAIQKQLMVIGSLITEISGECTSVTDSIRCSNKAVLCFGSNDVDHIREEVVNSLDGRIKMDVDPIPYRPSVMIHFPLKFL
jgi:hypothetical protein